MATTEQKPDELNMQLGIKPKPQVDANTLQKNQDLGAQVFSQNQEKYLYRISSNNQSNLFNFVENLDELKIISYSIDK